MVREFKTIKEAMKFINGASENLTIRKNKIFKSQNDQLIGVITF